MYARTCESLLRPVADLAKTRPSANAVRLAAGGRAAPDDRQLVIRDVEVEIQPVRVVGEVVVLLGPDVLRVDRAAEAVSALWQAGDVDRLERKVGWIVVTPADRDADRYSPAGLRTAAAIHRKVG